MTRFRSNPSDFSQQVMQDPYRYMPVKEYMEGAARDALQKSSRIVVQAVNETLSQLVFHYEQTYNIRALRPGKPFACHCMHKAGWHEATSFTECWMALVDEYAQSLTEDWSYERDLAHATGDDENEWFNRDDDTLWHDAVNVCYDNFGSNDPNLALGWFWYWGDSEERRHPYEDESGIPLRQFFAQLPLIRQRKRPQKHEDFADGNDVPYQPNHVVEKHVDDLYAKWSRLEKIRDAVNKRLPETATLYLPKLFDQEDHKGYDKDWGKENPLGFLKNKPFDGWPADHTKTQSYYDIPDYEILAYYKSLLEPEKWLKFTNWLQKSVAYMPPQIFDAAEMFYTHVSRANGDFVEALRQNRHGIDRFLLMKLYLDSHWGDAFHKWWMEEHSTPFLDRADVKGGHNPEFVEDASKC